MKFYLRIQTRNPTRSVNVLLQIKNRENVVETCVALKKLSNYFSVKIENIKMLTSLKRT